MPALLPVIARHPVLVFVVIGLGVGFLTAAIRPSADAKSLILAGQCALARPGRWYLVAMSNVHRSRSTRG
jgi:hypothetical protein